MKKINVAVEDFYDKDFNFNLTKVGYENICNLCDIVISRHFYSNPSYDKEDLKQVGLYKALSLLKRSNYNPTKASLFNYLYTGIRNEIHNYVYKMSKDFVVDSAIMDTNTESICNHQLSGIDSSCLDISKETLKEVCKDKTDESDLSNSLSILGFKVEDFIPTYEIENEERTSILQAVLLWRLLYKSKYSGR